MRWAWLIACCLVWPAIAPAEWYQWRDANGTLHVANQATAPDKQAPAAARETTTAGSPVTTLTTNPSAAVAADPRADRRHRLQLRLQNNLRHLALINGAPAGDPGRAELQNTLTDAVRADREALAALDRETAP
jgi:hypothetical protein